MKFPMEIESEIVEPIGDGRALGSLLIQFDDENHGTWRWTINPPEESLHFAIDNEEIFYWYGDLETDERNFKNNMMTVGTPWCEAEDGELNKWYNEMMKVRKAAIQENFEHMILDMKNIIHLQE
jgi:hypothetical protein